MKTKTKQWADGSSATIQYDGQGDGQIIITSDPNEHYEARSMQITVETSDGSGIQREVTVNQAAKQRIDLSAAVVTASNQTYNGSAKTPTPTVTLNGSTVPSSGYDVSYSNNTNAGTAIITITGKGDYTGTAYGTFTINKATGYAGVSSRSLTYSRSAQNLVTTSGNTGTVHYRLGTSGSWSTSIPTSTNAGTYTIYYYVDASTNYNAVGSSSSPYNVSTTIAKRTPVLSTSPSARTGLSYTGSAQNLLSGGAMKHSSSNSTSVGGTFTYAKGTNAGTYSSLTWSFTPTDSTNYNSTSGSISGSVTIAKASRTLNFADSYMVLNTSGTGTKTATPSAGSGDGAITYSIANTTYATINSSTGTVTAKTNDGSVIVTATIAAGTNYKSASASYTLYVFATTHDYSYSGSAKNVTLPPGTYQFQCWGAQGASCSDGYSGGKGGYSVGQLSIANALAIQVLVGGQNGYNGGGSSSGSASYSSGDTYGHSSMGNGGGASDIRLSDGTLLSRMIVAGGGSGGAYCYKEVTTETGTYSPSDMNTNIGISGTIPSPAKYYHQNNGYWGCYSMDVRNLRGNDFSIDISISGNNFTWQRVIVFVTDSSLVLWQNINVSSYVTINSSGTYTGKVPNDATYMLISHLQGNSEIYCTITFGSLVFTTTQTTDSSYQYGYAGGGTTGAGYSSTYQGKQNAAGSDGSFGQGANQTATNYRYCSGAGGGGWYGGGGGKYSNSAMSTVSYSGGGSGWVNIAANAGNRPSGYTGLELDSGTTYAGNTSFPSTGGGTETGHSGNGYARITRLE